MDTQLKPRNTLRFWPVLLLLALILTACSIEVDYFQDTTTPANGTVVFEQTAQTAPQPTTGELQIDFLDVGQADAILITHKDQAQDTIILIDAGEKKGAEAILSVLDERGVSKLDYVFATHAHSDHIGGMARIVEDMDIGTFYMPKAMHTTKTFERLLEALDEKGLRVTTPQPGNQIEVGGLTLTIIAPNSDNYQDLNNTSIGLIVSYGSVRFLMAGDAEEQSELEMLESGISLDVDVYKVSHHGSNSSSTPAFLDAMSPQYAVVSCGAGNSYGHPHEETLQALNERQIQIFQTDVHGTVTMKTDGQTLEVLTQQ